MSIFYTSINQMAFLFFLIITGYILVKCRTVPDNAATVLAKLENTVFIPALVLETFIKNFTIERIGSVWKLFLISFITACIMISLAILISRLCTKDRYIRNIYTYGLSFSNFGFMGNAVVSAVFPDIFFDYLIFTLPLWILIYLWGVPILLISSADKKQPLKENLKSFINPMFIAMIIGIIIGLANIALPTWAKSVVSASGSCMSPIAMLLTGITVAKINMRKVFAEYKIYIVSFIRLILFPLIFIGIFALLPCSDTVVICTVCSLAMPLGLNTIVVPSCYGKDTSIAAGMVIISHLLSCVTIPLIFLLMTKIL